MPHPSFAQPSTVALPGRRSRARTPGRLVVVVVPAVVLVLALRGPAAGAQTPPPTTAPATAAPTTDPGAAPKDNAVFGIGPANAQGVDGRPLLNYVVTPGAGLSDNVAVVNVSTAPVTVAVYATDVVPGANGAADLPPASVAAVDAGTWISLSLPDADEPDAHKTVTIAPRATVIVPVSIKVPADATPGDHAAGIVASLTADATNERGDLVHVDQRVAVRSYFRVGGALAPNLAIENLQASYDGSANPVGKGDVTMTYTVRNTGNIKVSGEQRADVTGFFRTKQDATALSKIPLLLPGGSIDETVHIADVAPEVVGVAGVHVTPVAAPGDSDPALPPADAEVRVWTVPATLLVIVGMVLLAIVGRGIVRRRRTRSGGTGEGSGAGGTTVVASSVPTPGRALTTNSRRRLVPVIGTMTLLWLAAGAVAVVAPPVAHAADVPFGDPAVTGYIGLCTKTGEPIDHGRVSDAPFVWAAVASSPAPAPYDANGRTATLMAFQPRDGVDPREWSGMLLTSSARYDNPAHPKGQSTDADEPLATFVGTYPPSWDGLIQLRIYLGAPEQAPYSEHYAATVIRVSGDNWSVVQGGNVPCNITNAVSLETLLSPPTTVGVSPSAPVPTSPPSTLAPTSVVEPVGTDPAPDPADAATHDGSGETAGGRALDAAPTDSRSPGVVIATVAGLAALLALAVFAIGRRRSST